MGHTHLPVSELKIQPPLPYNRKAGTDFRARPARGNGGPGSEWANAYVLYKQSFMKVREESGYQPRYNRFAADDWF